VELSTDHEAESTLKLCANINLTTVCLSQNSFGSKEFPNYIPTYNNENYSIAVTPTLLPSSPPNLLLVLLLKNKNN